MMLEKTQIKVFVFYGENLNNSKQISSVSEEYICDPLSRLDLNIIQAVTVFYLSGS